MAVEEKVTFCRICEALCGIVATVEDGRVIKLRPDEAHPLSRGFACPKGIAMTEIQNDPDRVLYPQRRRSDGEFERVSWETALADIGERLRRVRDAHGTESIGMYVGNPSAFSYAHSLWAAGLASALKTKHVYGAGSQDVNNRFAASALLYGTPLVVPIPDVPRTDFLLIVGANPLVSHGSVLTAPRLRDDLTAIVERGGRVVVCDPRRSETARRFEHIPVQPDADAWLLLSILNVMFGENLVDERFLANSATGAAELERLARAFPAERTAERTGVAAARTRELARDFAGARSAAAYGRTGSCLGRFGTLVAFLLDAINAVSGNLDRPGGAVFGHSAVALEKLGRRLGLDSYDERRSRIGGFPDVLGNMPAALIAQEIDTPGEGQLRALVVSAGNPVLSVPDGVDLSRALSKLDLLISLDLYVNETGRQADYILPTTTFLERDDVPVALLSFYTAPFVQYTEAVVAPAGEAREEWQILNSIAGALGLTASASGAARLAGRFGLRASPRTLLDLLLRVGPDGDRFGLRRGGLSLRRLNRAPHGVRLSEYVPTGVQRKRVVHRGGRVQLAPEPIAAEVRRLAADRPPSAQFPLRLIGLRELRSHNSWMHNSPKLMRARTEPALRIHPRDAGARNLADGARATIVSPSGTISVPVKLSDDMMEGVVAMPHGWGHRGGWQIANAAGGANVNDLTSTALADLEPLAGMAHLNGVPVQVQGAL
ncbi:MAG: molybdopterin-containing oxidoreductase family protein [Solirubrobacteraceae bacterium]